jgi:hypothetical protein
MIPERRFGSANVKRPKQRAALFAFDVWPHCPTLAREFTPKIIQCPGRRYTPYLWAKVSWESIWSSVGQELEQRRPVRITLA